MDKYATFLGYVLLTAGGLAGTLLFSWGFILWALEIPVLKRRTRLIMILGISAYKKGYRDQKELPTKPKEKS